jgi:ribonuclease P protein component
MAAGAEPRRYRFGRAASMSRRADFDLTRREGRVSAAAAFVVHALARPGEGRKLGIICPRRVGSAVARNRVKRRVREVFRTSPELFRDGWWFTVTARPPAAGMPFADLRAALIQTLSTLTADDYEPRP